MMSINRITSAFGRALTASVRSYTFYKFTMKNVLCSNLMLCRHFMMTEAATQTGAPHQTVKVRPKGEAVKAGCKSRCAAPGREGC